MRSRPILIYMKILKLILSIVLSFSAAAIGNIATIPNIPSWYQTLEKPFFNPPNWVFGPVWTVLYTLIGISLYLIWTSPAKESKTKAYYAFAAQLALNTLWSIVFFGLHNIALGLGIILLLIISILITI